MLTAPELFSSEQPITWHVFFTSARFPCRFVPCRFVVSLPLGWKSPWHEPTLERVSPQTTGYQSEMFTVLSFLTFTSVICGTLEGYLSIELPLHFHALCMNRWVSSTQKWLPTNSCTYVRRSRRQSYLRAEISRWPWPRLSALLNPTTRARPVFTSSLRLLYAHVVCWKVHKARWE